MKIQLAIGLLVGMAAVSYADTANEKAVKAYYTGFETHDWNMVAGAMADGFTFTTQVNDHISAKDFKETCWPTNKFTKKANLLEMIPSGDKLFVLVEIKTTDNKLVRNVDIYTFSAGKIKTVEVFFGPGESYPGKTSK
jgi:SnoaL-like domain